MSVSKWAYDPKYCDGEGCPGDCDLCYKPKIMDDDEGSDYIKREGDEWCTDCKEYDNERHCCPRWNRVIRETMDEIRKNAEKNWDKVEVVRCKDCKYHVEFQSKCNKLHLTPMLPNDYCSYGEKA